MNDTLLTLEGKCNLLLENKANEVIFFCDGLNTLQALFLLPEIKEINLLDFFLEIGEGEKYKCWEAKDFKQIDTFSDIKNIFKLLTPEIYIFKLKFISEKFTISINDNRFFTISSELISISEMTALITTLIANIFLFSNETCIQLINALVKNNNNYILINDSGEIMNINENYDNNLISGKN